MVLGKPKERPVVKRLTVEQKIKEEMRAQVKMKKLADAIRIPPAINQFKTFLSESETEKVIDLFLRYRPENKVEKAARKATENPRAGPKPILVKFGLNHVTELIERKMAKLVLISGSVEPIDIVVYIPTLCRKMDVPYAIVKDSVTLGRLVNLKSTSCVCLCDVRQEDEKEFKDIISTANTIFLDNYERNLSTWGGSANRRPIVATQRK